MKLHDDEVDTDAALVERLLAEQFPRLAGSLVRPVRSTGTVNAIHRVGEDVYARLPRLERHVDDLRREREWLPRLAPALSLRIPEPVAHGRPGAGYPFPWALYRWLEGAPYAGDEEERAAAGAGERAGGARAWTAAAGAGGPVTGERGVVAGARAAAAGERGGVAGARAAAVDERGVVADEPVAAAGERAGAAGAWTAAAGAGGPVTGERGVVADERAAAVDLARFVAELRAVPVTGDAPRGGRAPLRELDAVTRAALTSDAALRVWEETLEAPPFTGPPVWIHGDLLRPNLLVRDGRLIAAIDFGCVGVGDPAADVVAAWAVFTRPGREAFRAALGVDDDTWRRARGYALHQAALIIPYYAETNPGFVAHAERTVAQVLAN